MKKIITLVLLAAMMLTLASCAGAGARLLSGKPAIQQQEQTTPAPTPTQDPAAALAASDTDATVVNTPPASSTDTQAVNDNYQKAQNCVGRPVQELYAAVGQPIEEPAYGPSCLQDNAEDGMLTFDGFFVWTVRTETEELVQEVYLDE